jgi:hypothetical protein
MDRRLTKEDLYWLRRLRNAKAANEPSPDLPTSVVRKLTQFVCAEIRRGIYSLTRYSIAAQGRDELTERERESS